MPAVKSKTQASVQAMPTAAIDPLFGFVIDVLWEGKAQALFSMLFGAGLVLLSDRMVQTGRAGSAADLLLRRCLWLVPFGMVHRFGLQWSGDILYQYGLLGLIAIPFRNLRARSLLVCGCVVLALGMSGNVLNYTRLVAFRDAAAKAVEAEQKGEALSPEADASRKRWQARVNSIPPAPEAVQVEVAAMRGSYVDVFAHRWNHHHTFQSVYLYYVFVFDVLGMMLLGMGLMRIGFFGGTCSGWVYGAAVIGGIVGACIAAALAWAWQQAGFSAVSLRIWLWRELSYPWTRALAGLGFAALVILTVRRGGLRRVTEALSAVGRLAFSNYVLQTVCCSLWFFGYGFGYYGTHSRSQLMLVVLAVTAIQLVFSVLWLRRFRFGPLEWVWRSLTYWRMQPMCRAVAAADVVTTGT